MKVAIAEFRARNIKENPITTFYFEYENGFYYYLTFNGYKSHKYNSLSEGKEEVKRFWGNWIDFKFLI